MFVETVNVIHLHRFKQRRGIWQVIIDGKRVSIFTAMRLITTIAIVEMRDLGFVEQTLKVSDVIRIIRIHHSGVMSGA